MLVAPSHDAVHEMAPSSMYLTQTRVDACVLKFIIIKTNNNKHIIIEILGDGATSKGDLYEIAPSSVYLREARVYTCAN